MIELKGRQEEILKQQKQHSEADKTHFLTRSKVLELASRASEIFENSKAEQKRQLLQYLLQNSELNGKKLDISLKKPFDAILIASKTEDWLPV